MTLELTIHELSAVLLANLDPTPDAFAVGDPIFDRSNVLAAVWVLVVAFTQAFAVDEIPLEFGPV